VTMGMSLTFTTKNVRYLNSRRLLRTFKLTLRPSGARLKRATTNA
jgi:hypothetical protein